MELNFI